MSAPAALNDVLLDHCGQAILAVDSEQLNVIYANAEAARLLECKREELLNCSILDIEAGIEDRFFWQDAALGMTADVPCVEGLYRTRRGRHIPVEKSIYRHKVDKKTLFIVAARDITAFRSREDLAARTASLLAATLESTADGILVVELGGHIQNFNRRLAQIFRIPAGIASIGNDEAVFSTLRSAFRDRTPWDELQTEIATDPYHVRKLTLHLIDERVLDCVARPQLLRGQVIGRLFSFSEATDRARYEQALLAARDAADKANHAKSQFLSAMSHELKTPLHAILGFAELLELDAYPRQTESLRTIQEAGNHLLALINQVLDLASIEAGRIELHIRAIELSTALNEALKLTQPLGGRYRVLIECESPPETGCRVMADPLRLRQMLLNLISNAAKYNRPGGYVRIAVEKPENHPDHWRIIVQDNGIGIAEDDLARLFKPFTRVGAYQREVEGAGLGLVHTRRLAELHHGTIGVTSEESVGSRFWLDLPAA